MVTRVFPDGPVPTAQGLADYRREAKRVARYLSVPDGIEPMTAEQFVESMRGRKRRIYSAAKASLDVEGVTRRDARISMFVKAEKMEGLPAKAVIKPRAIQARHPRYNLSVGRFLKPMEGRLYGYRGPPRGVPRSRLIAKGLNQQQRAQLLQRKMSHFTKPRLLTTDVASFDGSVRKEHMQAVHGIYASLCNSPEFLRLLAWQLENVGRTAHGIRYKTKGKRMSGDMDTALGNCLIVLCAIFATLRRLNIAKWDILDDGDDCLIIVEEDSVVPGFPGIFAAGMQAIGFVCKSSWCGSHTSCEMEDIAFCRGRPVLIGSEYRFVREPVRALAGFLCTHRHYFEPRGARRVMKGMAQCELIVGRGLPCLQPLAVRVLKLLEGEKFSKTLVEEEFAFKARLEVADIYATVDAPAISMATRHSFERAFGISVEQQLSYERWASSIRLEHIDPALAVPCTADASVGVDRLCWNWHSDREELTAYRW